MTRGHAASYLKDSFSFRRSGESEKDRVLTSLVSSSSLSPVLCFAVSSTLTKRTGLTGPCFPRHEERLLFLMLEIATQQTWRANTSLVSTALYQRGRAEERKSGERQPRPLSLDEAGATSLLCSACRGSESVVERAADGWVDSKAVRTGRRTDAFENPFSPDEKRSCPRAPSRREL